MCQHRVLETGSEVRILIDHVRADIADWLLTLRLLSKLTRLVLLLILMVELSDEAGASAQILVALVRLIAEAAKNLLRLHTRKLIALHDEDGRPDLDDVVHLQRVQGGHLALGREAKPGPVRRADILQVEALRLVWRAGMVADLRMEVAHLGVFLHVETILGVATNR